MTVRALGLVVLCACTFNGPGANAPVTPKPDPDGMPSEVLDRQDPGADTSKNPVLWSSGSKGWFPDFNGCGNANYSSGESTFIGCGSCASGDASGLLVVLAALGTVRRRRSMQRS